MQVTDDANGIHDFGHRAFVGGDEQFWNTISELQFTFLVSEGLKPSDTFLDVACGSLRGGTRTIPYLDRGHYIAFDKHVELIIYGVASELGLEIFKEKRPRFVISDRFEFDRVAAAPTFGIAQSLFTHLTPQDIVLCLGSLRPIVAPACRFFATFHETEAEASNPAVSNSLDNFHFTRHEMEDLGRQAGWTPRYIGAWDHPRDQRIIEFRT